MKTTARRGRTEGRVRALALVVTAVVSALLWSTHALPKKQKPQPCLPGRFLVQGAPLIHGVTTPSVEAVIIAGKTVAINTGCGVVNAKLTATKKATVVTARWPRGCVGLVGKVLLRATIAAPDCGTMQGKLTARKSKVNAPFRAVRSSCGDGTFDPDNGEQCDADRGCSEDQVCDAVACRCGSESTTGSTTTSTSTSTTTEGPTTTARPTTTTASSSTTVSSSTTSTSLATTTTVTTTSSVSTLITTSTTSTSTTTSTVVACRDGVVNQPDEECDPPDDGACPGECQSDCKCSASCPTPTITGIEPAAGPPGTEVTITGTALDCGVTRALRCGDSPAVITAFTSTSLKTVIPAGADDCVFALEAKGGTATTPAAFDVTASTDFLLALRPAEAEVLQGAAITYQVSANSAAGFSMPIALGVSGLPGGTTGDFFPAEITAGQTATLTVSAAGDAPLAAASITLVGTAVVDGLTVSHSVPAILHVMAGGQTAILGKFVLLNGPPLEGVKLTLAGQTTHTDAGGNFQFVGIPAGKQTMSVDATPADPRLPIYGVDVEPVEGRTLQLQPFQICPPLPDERYKPLQNQDADQAITDETAPGATFMVPAGVTITGWDGKPKTRMTIQKLMPWELPVPQPPASAHSFYQPFFGTPMGGLPSAPIPVSLPNDQDLSPGDKAEFWSYDAAPFPGVPGEWRKIGMGTVSDDGATVTTDPGVGITRFCGVCGLTCILKNQDTQPSRDPNSPTGADPVDLALGQMIVEKTDLVLPGRIPAVIHRTYNPFDAFGSIAGVQLALGPGWALSVEVVLQNETTALRRLVMPGNARFAFVQQPDGTFLNTDHALFAGAVLTAGTDGTHALRLKDGTVWRFVPAPRVAGLSYLADQTDRNGNRLTIERDTSAHITRIVEPAGRELTVTYAGNRLTSVSDPIGRTVSYAYVSGILDTVTDAAGGTTRYTYTTGGRIATITDPRGITYIKNSYDADGRIARQELADGGAWTFEYQCAPKALLYSIAARAVQAVPAPPPTVFRYGCGPAEVPIAVTVTDPLGRKTTTSVDQRATVDALGQTTRIKKDERGQVVEVTDPIGRVTKFAYDAAGNVTQITDALGGTRRFEYEPTFNRVTRVTDAVGDTATFAYDADGNLVEATVPPGQPARIAYDAFGTPTSITDALGNATTLTYDSFGNLTATSDPLGHTTARAYDEASRLVALTDARGRTTRLTYDALDQLDEIRDPLGNTTTFSHDPNGNLLQALDALDRSVGHEYDAMDRLIRRTDALGGTESFGYDRAGNLVQYTDRKGQVATFEYDQLNRRIRGEYPDAVVTSTYDAIGRLTRVTDSAGGDILNAYDVLDRLVRQTTESGAVQYAYDAAGRPTSMAAPDQAPVTYEYDAASRPTHVVRGGAVAELTYDAIGRRQRLSLPNGVTTDYAYDEASRLVALTYRNGGAFIGDLTYDYDPVGRRIGVGGSLARSLLPSRVSSASYDDANRQLELGGKRMSFDANGNLTSVADASGTTTLSWDARDRLTGITGPGQTVAMRYDAFGRRVAKVVNGRATTYRLDGTEVVGEVADGRRAEYLRTRAVDETLARSDSDGTFYLLQDALRSTVALLDESGGVVRSFSYDPFGTTAVSGGASVVPFQFTGRENDANGLYFYRARYYSPANGRFISEDPIGLAGGGPNYYLYALDDPTNLTDPSGRIVPLIVIGAISGGVSGLQYILTTPADQRTVGGFALHVGAGFAAPIAAFYVTAGLAGVGVSAVAADVIGTVAGNVVGQLPDLRSDGFDNRSLVIDLVLPRVVEKIPGLALGAGRTPDTRLFKLGPIGKYSQRLIGQEIVSDLGGVGIDCLVRGFTSEQDCSLRGRK